MPAKYQSSPIEDLLLALSLTNPFARPPVVKAQNIWGESFPDVSSLNAHASNAVYQTLETVKTASSSIDKVKTIVVTADRGVGKTHVIKRIRKHIQAGEEALFVYSSADQYGDLNFINSAFQRSLAESLEQSTGKGFTQWQEIASLIIADAFKGCKPGTKVPSTSDLLKKFDKAIENKRIQGKDLISDLVKVIRKTKPEIDPYIIRAIIWTLSEERGPIAVKWLAGEGLDIQDAADLRLPPNEKTDQEREASALTTVVKILSIIGQYKMVLICFDELDSIVCDANGYSTTMVVADLIKRLFDSIYQPETGQGIVILSVFLPDLWNDLDSRYTSRAKVCTAFNEAISLNYTNFECIQELVTLWLQDFYKTKELKPPTNIYPFDDGELLQYAKGKPSVREVLKWCADALPQKVQDLSKVIGPTPPLSPREKFECAYNQALEEFSSDFLDDDELIASTLRFSFEKLISIDKISGIPIEGVALKKIEDVLPKAKNNGYLNFKAVGTENGKTVAIGVSVLQKTYGLSVGAGFKRLLDYKTFHLTRGCLVRSRGRKLKRNWDSYEYYQKLVSKGGEWVDLKVEEIKPLLALKYVYDNHESFDLTIKRLDSFASTQKIFTENPLIREILSKPEGQLHEEALEGETLKHLYTEEECQEISAHLTQGDNEVLGDSAEYSEEQLDLSELEVA